MLQKHRTADERFRLKIRVKVKIRVSKCRIEDRVRITVTSSNAANSLVGPFYQATHHVCIVHIYPPYTRKRIVSLYLGRDVRTRLGVAISEVSGQPVFHIQAGASR